jgi:hypothetical protein
VDDGQKGRETPQGRQLDEPVARQPKADNRQGADDDVPDQESHLDEHSQPVSDGQRLSKGDTIRFDWKVITRIDEQPRPLSDPSSKPGQWVRTDPSERNMACSVLFVDGRLPIRRPH